MIVAHLGSAPWAAASQNLAAVIPLSIGLCTVVLQLFSLLLTTLMGSRFSVGLIIKSLLLAVFFGLLIDVFVNIHHFIYTPDQIWVRGLYTLIGMNGVAAAISIYIQISRVLLPFDYLLQAFARLAKSFSLGTIICLSIPLTICTIFSFVFHQFIGLGIGTLVFILANGFLIEQYNKKIMLTRTELS